MLQILHLATGCLALALSIAPALGGGSPPFPHGADATYLFLFGLLNLLQVSNAGQSAYPVSGLLLLSVALQALVLLLPLEHIGDQPAVLLGLSSAAAAILLQLWPNPLRAAATARAGAPADPQAHLGVPDGRETGTVKWFNSTKGFGFIACDTGEDVFVHFRAIRGAGQRVLLEGQQVEFSLIEHERGLQAADVVARPGARRRREARNPEGSRARGQ